MASLRHPCYPYSTHVCRREGDDLNLDDEFALDDDEDGPGEPGSPGEPGRAVKFDPRLTPGWTQVDPRLTPG
jgi:hypothetical protein